MNTASDGIHEWVVEIGTGGIQSNQAYFPVLVGGVAYATIDYGVRDCKLQFTIATVGRPFGAILGWEGTAADMIRIRCEIIATVHRLTIQLFRTGQTTLALNTVDGIVWANGDVMKVVLSGQTVDVLRNGVSVASANDSRVNDITGTEHGLYAASTAARFEDFSITP